MVSAFTRAIGIWTFNIALSSGTYEGANRAVYYPVILPDPCVVRRVWWANGSNTAGGATIEAGVYSDSGYSPGSLLVSGSATQGTANQVQFVNCTDTTIGPGLYWIALRSSSTSSTTLQRRSMSTDFDAGYRFQQASASPLPATATPVESDNSSVWLFGFATTASP
jgi:hypothetical protein